MLKLEGISWPGFETNRNRLGGGIFHTQSYYLKFLRINENYLGIEDDCSSISGCDRSVFCVLGENLRQLQCGFGTQVKLNTPQRTVYRSHV